MPERSANLDADASDGRSLTQPRSAPRPDIDVDLAGLARSFGCPAARVETHEELVRLLDETVPGLADRREPLLLEVAVVRDPAYQY